MSYFKKFTNFCAGFAAFSALASLFFKFMEYTPYDEQENPLGFKEKLKLFFDANTMSENYKLYLLLAGTLLFSLVISCLCKKIPAIAPIASLFPLALVATMYADGVLPERPMLYLLLAGIHTAGAIYECIHYDRERKTTHQAHLSAALVAGIGALGTLFVWYSAKNVATIPPQSDHYFMQKLYRASLFHEDPSILWKIAVIFLVTVLLSFLWRELYFLDAAVALIPTIFIFAKYLSGELPICAEFLFVLATVHLIFRIAIMLSCSPSKKTDQSS